MPPANVSPMPQTPFSREAVPSEPSSGDARDGTAASMSDESAWSAAAEVLPVIGKIVGGNFRVLKLIGSGAMGHVFQAEQLSLGKMVALKLLRRELQTDEKLTKRFELEAKNASSLDHPNSIRIIDFGRDGELLYIAMELLPGVDLGQLILREGPLPFSRLGRIMDQVLGALDEAHAHGIVHRDLKPGNIMLVSRRGDPDLVKVCDFGIAKAQASTESEGLTLKGLVCGTPEYMSPEQARGEDVDGRSDLYSVGVILYQLVTGDLPFRDTSPVGILSKHLSEAPVPPSLKRPGLSIPASLEAVILRALAKEPAHRPASADRMRQELRAALTGIVEPATTPGSGQRPLPAYAELNFQPTTPIGLEARATAPIAPSPVTDTMVTRRRSWFTWVGLVGVATALLVAWWGVRRRPAPTNERPNTQTEEHNKQTAAAMAPAGAILGSAAVVIPSSSPNAESKPVEADPLPAAEPPAVTAGVEAANKIAAPTSRRRRADRLRAAAPAPAAALTGASIAAEESTAPEAEPPVVPARPARAANPNEAMKDAERLMREGDIAGACRKGEDQKQATPEVAQVHRFLGKCYMRAGQAQIAKTHYRRYLELAPAAADAAFIRSIVK